ncbi:MAG: hypothetical protein LBS11_12175 [Oscillospiraceae bacterium]|jgi:hypothetical protein|nr:hypothetical protein [Oscillospiraceae bacterium]
MDRTRNRFTDELASARIHVFVGNYGSGKTELSLNVALYIAALGQPTVMIDLDIVNPYFRGAEQEERLNAAGVRVIAPVFARTALDIPVLPPQIQSVFDNPRERVVIDVGGDDTGAAALGQFAHRLRGAGARLWYVINACRPLSSDIASNRDLMARIASRSRLNPDGLIHNTNLGDDSDAQTVNAAHPMLETLSRETGTPIVAVTGEARLMPYISTNAAELFWPIERFMRPEFFD